MKREQTRFTKVSLCLTPTEISRTWFSHRTSVDLDPEIRCASRWDYATKLQNEVKLFNLHSGLVSLKGH